MRKSSFWSVLVVLSVAVLLSTSGVLANAVGPFFWVPKAAVIAVNGGGVEGAATSVIGGSIYASHGYSFGDSAALRIYSIAGDGWVLGPAASVARSEGAGATVGGKHYSIGGRPASIGVGDALEIFDPGAGTWAFGTSMPTPRRGFCATEFGGKIHAIGGSTGGSPATGIALAAHEVYDPAFDSWAVAAPLPTAVMGNYACVALKGKIYVFGGDSGPGVFVGLTQIYDPGTDSWSAGAPMPTARSNAIAGVLDCHPVVIGGYQGFGNLNVVEIYHPDTDSWTVGPVKPTPSSELGVSMPGSGSAIFAVGSGIFGASSPVHEALVGGEAGCRCEPDPRTQGYWHRQCLGAGLITPGRNGRGPTTILEPDFLKTLVPAVDVLLQATIFAPPTFLTCEDGIDAVPPSDPCERALKQYTAMLLNIESDRLQDNCDVDLTATGCSSTTIGELIDELAALINSGDADSCRQAADCAGEVNEGGGGVVPSGLTAPPTAEAFRGAGDFRALATAAPSSDAGDAGVTPASPSPAPAGDKAAYLRGDIPDVATAAPANAPEIIVTTAVDATTAPTPSVSPVIGVWQTGFADTAGAEPANSGREAEETILEIGDSVERHLAVLANASSSDEARKASVSALLTALGGGYDLDLRLQVARALVGEAASTYGLLLTRHVEDIRDEAVSLGDGGSKRKAEELLNRLATPVEPEAE